MRNIKSIIKDNNTNTLEELRTLLELARINQMTINDILIIINEEIYKRKFNNK